MTVALPLYEWLIRRQDGRYVTNVYSGSVGTPRASGCVGACTFNYRVYVDTSDGDGDIRLIAEGFLIRPAVLGGQRTDIERATFAPSAEGVAQARAWLEALAAKHGF